MRIFNSTNIALEYLLLKATGKRFGKEKTLYDYFNGF